jgi:DNA-binding GntR family transcriptional regulator
MKRFVIKQSKTIRQKVYDYLRYEILNGHFRAGDRLVEAEIGNRIGTSRTPVREAFHYLERERLITPIPRVGYIVSEINEKELDELCELRLVLESLALQWAMKRAPSKLIESLKENISRAEKLLTGDDIKSFVESDSNFHDIISDYADSGRLQEITEGIRSYLTRYRIQSIYTKENVERAIAGHNAVLQKIEAGDILSAQNSLREHIVQSRDDILYFGLKIQPLKIGSIGN